MHDTAGNVQEWVEECYHWDYDDAPTDGIARLSANEGDCERRVLRGGSWYDGPGDLRSANRDKNFVTSRFVNFGFRIARTLSQ